MGLTERQILWKVELPLAAPEIFAGLQIATVSTVAIADPQRPLPMAAASANRSCARGSAS